MTVPGARVMIVDDEPDILRALHATLGNHGYLVVEATNGREALELLAQGEPDALVLDLGLPKIDGLELIRRVRATSALPIVVLSARDDERTKIEALDLGADDFVTKPFSVHELMARLRAALRRVPPGDAAGRAVLRAGPIALEPESRRVTVDGQEVHLTPIEYDLLRVMIGQPNKVFTHRMLLERVWGGAYTAAAHYLHVHLGNLRRKVEPNPRAPRYLVTEPGVGYRIRADDP